MCDRRAIVVTGQRDKGTVCKMDIKSKEREEENYVGVMGEQLQWNKEIMYRGNMTRV